MTCAHHFGFSWRKARQLRTFAGPGIRRLRPGAPPGTLRDGDTVYLWGDTALPPALTAASAELPDGPRVRLVRVEDGFLRSVGLGAAFATPLSWVFDDEGLHHWGHQDTGLSRLIRDTAGNAPMHARARRLRERLVTADVTKYNLPDTPAHPGVAARRHLPGPQPCDAEAPLGGPSSPAPRRRVLVIGQVADDAALRHVRTPVRSNLGLLEAVRTLRPEAWVIYRPHPDVVAGLRRGDDESWAAHADQRLAGGSLSRLLAQVDEVHVCNSLAGFEALLRGKPVVCHAQPFYAGWGLTEDRYPPSREASGRTTAGPAPSASLDDLVAAALIRYPRYRDPFTGEAVTVEQAVDLLLRLRSQPVRQRGLGGAAVRMASWCWRRVARTMDRRRLAVLQRAADAVPREAGPV